MSRIFILGFLLSFSTIAFAQINSNISLPNAVDGREINLHSYAKAQGVVVIFTSNHCPFDGYYQERINNLVRDFSGKGIDFVLINSYSDPDESVEKMKKHASKCGFEIPYLADKNQIMKNLLEVTKSPEVFILKKEKDSLKVFYRGAFDNNPQVEEDVKEFYLKDNLENLLNGRTATYVGTLGSGCRIR